MVPRVGSYVQYVLERIDFIVDENVLNKILNISYGIV